MRHDRVNTHNLPVCVGGGGGGGGGHAPLAPPESTNVSYFEN